MGKTDTIRERRVDVYLDSIDRKERWSRTAEEEGDSLSKFVQKCVEYAIEKGGLDFGELGEERKKIRELELEVRDLRKDVNRGVQPPRLTIDANRGLIDRDPRRLYRRRVGLAISQSMRPRSDGTIPAFDAEPP